MNEDQINETRPSDVSAVSTTGSTRRRKTAKEQLQNALAIQNDYKNRNIVTDPDREEDEFVCFIGKFYRATLNTRNHPFIIILITFSLHDNSSNSKPTDNDNCRNYT